MRDEILSEKHKYWNALCFRLTEDLRIEGCNYSNTITKKILCSLPNVDVAGTLEFFQSQGGYCDCEILNTIYRENETLY